MDLRPIEARADEFFTWVGRFDSGKRVDAAFASAADVPDLIDEVKRLRAAVRDVLDVAHQFDRLAAHHLDSETGHVESAAANEIRRAVTSHIDNTPKETYHPRRGTAAIVAAAALADAQERVRRIGVAGDFVKEADHA